MTDVSHLPETKLSFLGLTPTVEYSEEFRFGFAVHEYIVDVDFAYFVSKSVGDFVLHTELKVRASSFQSHSNPCQST